MQNNWGINRLIKGLGVISLASSIGACGFHLRGQGEVPSWLGVVYLQNDTPREELYSRLKNMLEGYSIQVTKIPKDARYQLILTSENLNQQIISVAASNGPRQFKLNYSLNFSCRATSSAKSQESTVFATRIFTENANTLLGSNNEAHHFMTELHQQALTQLLAKINARGCK